MHAFERGNEGRASCLWLKKKMGIFAFDLEFCMYLVKSSVLL